MNIFAQALAGQNQSQSAMNHAQQYAQQWQYQQYNAGMFNQMAAERQHRFMIDGRTMTFEQFLDEVAPEPSVMRTFLTLKYSGK
jgi:hypothetical protein